MTFMTWTRSVSQQGRAAASRGAPSARAMRHVQMILAIPHRMSAERLAGVAVTQGSPTAAGANYVAFQPWLGLGGYIFRPPVPSAVNRRAARVRGPLVPSLSS